MLMPRSIPDRFDRLLGFFALPSVSVRRRAPFAIMLGMAVVTVVVYATGGVRFAPVHLAYIPIIAAALLFEIPGGLVAGVVAGLLLGPLMPIDSTTGEDQTELNWFTRLVAFCIIGTLVGLIAGVLRRQMKRLQWLHEHDESTGLLSREGLLLSLSTHLAGSSPAERPLVVVIQLNNLLDIQNTFGPGFATAVLAKICERAREVVPDDLPIALIQPDRLAIVLPGEPEAQELRDTIENRLRQPYEVDGISAHVDFAVGSAAFPTHAQTPEELLQKASIAMHVAVKRGLPGFHYRRAADTTSTENLLLLGELPSALQHDQLEVWHQAKVALETNRVTGSEALLRWRHPQRGLIPPGNFIPQAEQSTLINDMTRWVVSAALADLAQSRAQGHQLGVSVNLSVRNLHNPSLLAALDETVEHHGLDSEAINLEITESAVMDDFELCVALVTSLRDRGYEVSIDDFGTGYSSLAYLKRLPVTHLKVDQAFIRDLAHDSTDQSIVRAVIGLAHSLGLKCIAEGVEDEESARLLRDWGCHEAQGFFFHRPCPHDEYLTRVSNDQRG